VVQLPGRVEIISIITKKSAKALTLSKGKQVYAIIKASNVMIATD
jgi:molybdopterin-binding protein